MGCKKSGNSFSQYRKVWISIPVIRLATLIPTALSALLILRSLAMLFSDPGNAGPVIFIG